jgi:hypothetical protein
VLSFCMTVALVALLNNNSAQGIVFWGQQWQYRYSLQKLWWTDGRLEAEVSKILDSQDSRWHSLLECTVESYCILYGWIRVTVYCMGEYETRIIVIDDRHLYVQEKVDRPMGIHMFER